MAKKKTFLTPFCYFFTYKCVIHHSIFITLKRLLHLNNTAFLHLGENIDTLEYSQDGSKLFGISEYGNKPFISVWDTETGDLRQQIAIENKAYNHHFQVFGFCTNDLS